MNRFEKEKQQILNTFKDHEIRDHQVIFRAGSPRVEVMTWSNKNGSSNCRIDYMIRNGSLAVYGDLGEAVYRWYGLTRLEWIAGLNLDYFHGKCEASGEGEGNYHGARPHSWDGKQAKIKIQSHIREWIKDGSTPLGYYKEHKGAKSELKELLRVCDELVSFDAYLNRGQPDLAVFDQDCWEWLPNTGKVIPIRIRMHLIGLKMAFGKKIGKYTN